MDWTGQLLDFAAAPGRYSTARGEPAALFARTREILLLACGRPVTGLPVPEGAGRAPLERAARSFVARAMLREGADHYTLLGVRPGFEPDALREHYRLLMRLTHPDFAVIGDGWPPDAATRINMANDVLSSSVRRAEYDRLQQALATSARSPVAAARKPASAVAPRPRGRAPRPRRDGLRGLRRIPGIGWLGTSVGVLAMASLAVLLTGTIAWWTTGELESELHAVPATVIRAPAKASTDQPMAMVGEPIAAPSAAPDVVREPDAGPSVGRPTDSPSDRPVNKASLAPVAPTNAGDAVAQRRSIVPPPSESPLATVRQVEARPAALPSVAGVGGPGSPSAPVAALPVAALPDSPSRAERSPRVVEGVPEASASGGGRISLADVQPTLAALVAGMQSGRGEDLAQWVDRSGRRGSDGVGQLVRNFNRAVAGGSSVRVSHMQFKGRAIADQFIVDGVVQLLVQDERSGGVPREIHLRAYFVHREGATPTLVDLAPSGP